MIGASHIDIALVATSVYDLEINTVQLDPYFENQHVTFA
jgi:hypothetical protein